jgi:hypothetical protein
MTSTSMPRQLANATRCQDACAANSSCLSFAWAAGPPLSRESCGSGMLTQGATGQGGRPAPLASRARDCIGFLPTSY